MSEPTKVQQAIALLRKEMGNSSSTDELKRLLELTLEILKSEKKNICYGCHCDLGPGDQPDGCVLDENPQPHCIYAGGLIDKWECKYWRPVLEKIDG